MRALAEEKQAQATATGAAATPGGAVKQPGYRLPPARALQRSIGNRAMQQLLRQGRAGPPDNPAALFGLPPLAQSSPGWPRQPHALPPQAAGQGHDSYDHNQPRASGATRSAEAALAAHPLGETAGPGNPQRTASPQARTTAASAAAPSLMRDAEEEATAEEPGFWGTIGGGLMGEFNEDPSFAMIGVDVGVSLIPILDQVSDARDIIAHLYYMIFRRQYGQFMRWLGLVFTLIGLIPEVGSAIKGASKFVIRGISEALSHLADILRFFQRILPDASDLSRIQRYMARHWASWVTFGTSVWNRTLDRIATTFRGIPAFVRQRLAFFDTALARIRELAPQKLHEAFAWVRRKWDELSERLRGSGPRQADSGEGAGDLVVRAGRLRVTHQHLLDWERAGGHMVQRHGPFHTRETLLQRLLNETSMGGMPPPRILPGGTRTPDFRLWQGERVPDASAWTSEATMLDTLSRVIGDNLTEIDSVTSRGGEFILEGAEIGQTVGRGWVTALRGAGERGIYWAEELQRVTMIIRPRPGGGWYVHTAFPHM